MCQKKKRHLFKAPFTVTLQLVAANCHLLGWASERGIRKSVHLSWALSHFLMLPIHNLPPCRSPEPAPLALNPAAVSSRGRQIRLHEGSLAGKVKTAP